MPGLDSVVLGPADLSASLGFTGDLEHPQVVAAIDHVIEKARKAGLFVGSGMGPDPTYASKMAKRGIQWLQVGGDYSYMIQYANQMTAEIRAKVSAE